MPVRVVAYLVLEAFSLVAIFSCAVAYVTTGLQLSSGGKTRTLAALPTVVACVRALIASMVFQSKRRRAAALFVVGAAAMTGANVLAVDALSKLQHVSGSEMSQQSTDGSPSIIEMPIAMRALTPCIVMSIVAYIFATLALAVLRYDVGMAAAVSTSSDPVTYQGKGHVVCIAAEIVMCYAVYVPARSLVDGWHAGGAIVATYMIAPLLCLWRLREHVIRFTHKSKSPAYVTFHSAAQELAVDAILIGETLFSSAIIAGLPYTTLGAYYSRSAIMLAFYLVSIIVVPFRIVEEQSPASLQDFKNRA